MRNEGAGRHDVSQHVSSSDLWPYVCTEIASRGGEDGCNLCPWSQSLTKRGPFDWQARARMPEIRPRPLQGKSQASVLARDANPLHCPRHSKQASRSWRDLPLWARRTKSLDALLPVLYLRGISTGDFQEALAALLGQVAPNLSPAVISRLTAEWQGEYGHWQKRDLSARRYLYVWPTVYSFRLAWKIIANACWC